MTITKPRKRKGNLFGLRRLGDSFFLIGVVAVIAAVVVLAKCAPKLLRADRSLQRVVSSGVITVGYSIEPPHSFLTPEGQVTGVAPEALRHIMGELGVRDIRWRKCEFGNLINELEAGHIDIISAGMVITSGRMQRVSFSHPVFIDPPSLLVAKGNPKNINHFQQFVDDPSLRVAVLLDAVEEQVYRNTEIDPARVLAMPDVPTLRAAIIGGVADAVALPLSIVRKMAADDRSERTEVNESYRNPLEEIPYDSAFACRKEDQALLRAVNKELDAFIGTEEYLSMISSFGFTQSNIPPSFSRRGASHDE